MTQIEELKKEILNLLKEDGVNPIKIVAQFLEERYGPELKLSFIEYCYHHLNLNDTPKKWK